MSLGFTEMVVLVAILLVFFGAGKLPTVIGDLAQGFRNFKRGLSEDEPAPTAAPPPPPALPRREPELIEPPRPVEPR